MEKKSIHLKDAIRLLESGESCDLKLWKQSTGDILEYKGVQVWGQHWRGGTHRVRFPKSGELRMFRDVCLFEINGLSVYL